MSFRDRARQVEILELFAEAQYLGRRPRNHTPAIMQARLVVSLRAKKDSAKKRALELRLRRSGRRFAEVVRLNEITPRDTMQRIHRSTDLSACPKCRKCYRSSVAAKYCCQPTRGESIMRVVFVEASSGKTLWEEERTSLVVGRYELPPIVQPGKKLSDWWCSKIDDSDPSGVVTAHLEPRHATNARALAATRHKSPP